MGPLLLLIYIKDFPDSLQSALKVFADDTFLASTEYDPNISPSQIENDLKKSSHWAYKWKMTSNSDLSKQAQEIMFSRKEI